MKRKSILLKNLQILQEQGEIEQESENSSDEDQDSLNEAQMQRDRLRSQQNIFQGLQERENIKETDLATQILSNQHLSKQAIMKLGQGLFSGKTLEKISKQRINPEAIRIISSIELNHIDVAREIALKQNFQNENQNFVNKGTAPKTAIEKGHQNFAKELLQAGYSLPEHFLLDAIRDEDDKLVKKIIEGNFYNLDTLKLEFWYLLSKGRIDLAKLLFEKENTIRDFVNQRGFPSIDQIKSFLCDPQILEPVIKLALETKADFLASTMLGMNPNILNSQIIQLALKHNNLEFIMRVWSGHFTIKQGEKIKKRKQVFLKNFIDQYVGENISDKKSFKKSLKITHILNYFLKEGRTWEAHQVLQWPDAAVQPGVLKICLQYRQQDLTKILLQNIEIIPLTSEDMEAAINYQMLQTALIMLQRKECIVSLQKEEIQEQLIKYLASGQYCAYAIDLLNSVPLKDWQWDLTKELCNIIIHMIKKTEEFLVCPAPILFCVLGAELCTRLSEATVQHKQRTQAVVDSLLELGLWIEMSIKDEDELRYYLLQSDSSNRSVLTILSINRFYKLLEHDQVGAIVSKLWQGKQKCYNVYHASSLYRSWEAPVGTEDSMAFTKGIDSNKPYIFQYDQWTKACQLRFWASAMSIFALVVIYQIVIYTSISHDSLEDLSAQDPPRSWLRLAQVWICCVIAEDIMHYVFSTKSGRGFEWDGWKTLNIFIFIIMILNMMEIGNLLNGDTKFSNSIMHSLMIILIWLRSMSVLITTKMFGPLLRMIYLMCIELIGFLFIIFSWMFVYCAIMTSLYNKDIPEQFNDFSLSFITLFSANLATFDIIAFENTTHPEIGYAVFSVYLVISIIVLMNLLIALLTNIYSSLSTKADAEHRAVVISYYNRYSWDERYGFLIFLPPPLNVLAFFITPIFWISENTYALNQILCKTTYIFYGFIMWCFFFVYQAILLVPIYIKGFIAYAKTGTKKKILIDADFAEREEENNQKESQEKFIPVPLGSSTEITTIVTNFNIFKFIAWIFVGLPWLLFAVIRDLYQYWKLMYKSIEKQIDEGEKNKFEQLVTSKFIKDIQVCLDDLKKSNKEKVSLDNFLEMWILIDHSMINTQNDGKSKQSAAVDNFTDRNLIAIEFFSHFSESSRDSNINVNRMTKILPKKKEYFQDYLVQVIHINIPWIYKALTRFQEMNETEPQQPEEAGLSVEFFQSVKTQMNILADNYDQLFSSIKELKKHLNVVTNEGNISSMQIENISQSLSLSTNQQAKKKPLNSQKKEKIRLLNSQEKEMQEIQTEQTQFQNTELDLKYQEDKIVQEMDLLEQQALEEDQKKEEVLSETTQKSPKSKKNKKNKEGEKKKKKKKSKKEKEQAEDQKEENKEQNEEQN